MQTDHPIPGLPFVDDSHLPVTDPAKIEALGRRFAEGMWGREDIVRDGGGWVAFTTDPFNVQVAWCVRWHPQHGRSVVLYRDDDISGIYMAYWGPSLLFRSGGYWWDGTTWFRPSQVWDPASEKYLSRKVPGATTITAADVLDDTAYAVMGTGPLQVIDVDPEAPPPANWLGDLAYWADHRTSTRPLTECVIQVKAPELITDELIGAGEVAEIARIAASTFRAYLARGENEIPEPQATVAGRMMWARPVAQEWAEQRGNSPAGITAIMAVKRQGFAPQPPGIAQIWDRYTRAFTSELWDRPEWRRRWALRWRTKHAVHDVAEAMAWWTAVDLPRIVPMPELAATLRKALLQDFAEIHEPGEHMPFYGITPGIFTMLTWLVLHSPPSAAHAIAGFADDAERTMGITRQVVKRTLLLGLSPGSRLDEQLFTEFLERVLPNGNGTEGS